MRKFLRLLLVTVLILTGCFKASDFEDIKLNINTSMPLGDLIFDDESLMNLASIDNLKYDENEITLIRDSRGLNILSENNTNKIFVVNNQIIGINETIPSGIQIGNEIQIPIPIEVSYKMQLEDGTDLTNMTLKGGVISFSGSSLGDYENLVCRIPEISLNGNAIEINPNTPSSLNEYTVTPNEKGEITLIFSGSIKNSSGIKCNIDIVDMDIKGVEGFFGNKIISEENFDIAINSNTSEFFNNIEDFYISNPIVTLNLRSNIDIPTLLIIKQILVDGQPLDLKEGMGSDRFLALNDQNISLTLSNNNFVQENALSKAITKSTSNIEVLVSATINPTKSQLEDDNIVIPLKNSFTDESFIAGNLNIDMPLGGYFKNISFKDNFEMGLDEDIRKYEYKNISYAITAENKFPLDIELKLYTEDANGNISQLGTQYTTIPSSLNNVNPKNGNAQPGVVDANNLKIITLDKAESSRFINAEKIIFELNASSKDINNKELINIYKGSSLKMGMILGVDGTINFD